MFVQRGRGPYPPGTVVEQNAVVGGSRNVRPASRKSRDRFNEVILAFASDRRCRTFAGQCIVEENAARTNRDDMCPACGETGDGGHEGILAAVSQRRSSAIAVGGVVEQQS